MPESIGRGVILSKAGTVAGMKRGIPANRGHRATFPRLAANPPHYHHEWGNLRNLDRERA